MIVGHQIASLRDINIDTDIVLMAEVAAEATYVKHHKRKIAFLFAAMRHFAEELRRAGTTVIYRRLDDPDNGGCLESELLRVIESRQISKLVVTMPGEYRLMEIMKSWQSSSSSQSSCGKMIGLSSLDRFTSWLMADANCVWIFSIVKCGGTIIF